MTEIFKSHEYIIHGAYRCGAVLDFNQLPDIENVIELSVLYLEGLTYKKQVYF